MVHISWVDNFGPIRYSILYYAIKKPSQKSKPEYQPKPITRIKYLKQIFDSNPESKWRPIMDNKIKPIALSDNEMNNLKGALNRIMEFYKDELNYTNVIDSKIVAEEKASIKKVLVHMLNKDNIE
jgi:predicted secreted protein